jgi:16S rRNA C1402 (ribose-2'-O) methylase RsmI
MKAKKIKNTTDLKEEIVRLRELSKVQEQIIRADVADIKESLKPKNILMDALESITGLKFDKNSIWENGLSAGLLLLLRKYISKAESKAEDTVYEIADRIFERIRHFISKYMHVRKHYPEDGDEGK